LLCGRRDTGQELVPLDLAETRPDLCSKCGRQVSWARRLDEIRRARKPGQQLTFDFVKEY